MSNIISFDIGALLLKEEGTYGTDPTPDGTNDAMLISNGQIRFQANQLSRDIDQAYMGARPFVLTGRTAFIEFDFEVMGAASAVDDPAPCSPILLACGHAETINASTSLVYNPISDTFDSTTGYFFIKSAHSSGGLKHIVTGLRGSIVFSQSINGYFKGRAVLQGQEVAISNAAIPAQTLSAFQDPIVIDTSTWTVTIDDGGGAFNLNCVELSLDSAMKPQLYETSEQQCIAITARDSQGFLRIMQDQLSDFDPVALAGAHTLCDIVSVVDGGATKKSQLDISTAQLGYPEEIDIDGAAGWRVPFTARPTTAGNDEYLLTFT